MLFCDPRAACVLITFALLSRGCTSNMIIVLLIALISIWLYRFGVSNRDDKNSNVEGMYNAGDISSYKNLQKTQEEILRNISTSEISLGSAEKIVENMTKDSNT